MTEDKRNTTTILIIVGIAIGIIYLLSRNNKQPATLSSNSDLNSIGIGLNSLNQRMNLIEQKLDKLETQLYQHQPITYPQIPVQQPISPSQPTQQIQQTSPVATYKNTEVTEYVKDKDGDIIKKIVTRDAKIDDKR